MSGPLRALTNQVAKRIVLRLASGLGDGELTAVFPDGQRRMFGRPGATPRANLRIHDDAFFARVLTGGEIGFGEAYVHGLWSTDDLPGLLAFGIGMRSQVRFDASWLTAATRLSDVRLHRGNKNTKDRARHNIHAHYDLGNDFFRLWLDESMTYSCAYFDYDGQPLAEAQANKYRLLCEKAQITSTDHVLEIGSGWGGFAIFVAERYGCRVTSITISQEQLALARQRVAEAGLSDLVDVQFRDYRDLVAGEGMYDKVVSIEMFEAVGAEYFPAFFETIDHVLRPGGLVAMQTITVPDRSYAGLRDGVNWVQKYIFPGGMLPSIAEIERALHKTRFVIDAVDDIGAHYATTLRLWRERFLQQRAAVVTQGFDDRFIRMWEYYLAASEAGFMTRNTGDIQLVLAKPGARTLPRVESAKWDRDRLPETMAR